MSVLVEAINVIVCKETLERKYPGGLLAYERECPNETFCADDHLTRVGLMSHVHVQKFIDRLVSFGFVFYNGEKFVDVAVVDQTIGLTAPCDWLQAGKFPEGFAGCWLAGTEDTWTAFPNHRTPQDMLATNMWLPAQGEQEFVGHAGNLTVFRDTKTGRLSYTARAFDEIATDKAKLH